VGVSFVEIDCPAHMIPGGSECWSDWLNLFCMSLPIECFALLLIDADKNRAVCASSDAIHFNQFEINRAFFGVADRIPRILSAASFQSMMNNAVSLKRIRRQQQFRGLSWTSKPHLDFSSCFLSPGEGGAGRESKKKGIQCDGFPLIRRETATRPMRLSKSVRQLGDEPLPDAVQEGREQMHSDPSQPSSESGAGADLWADRNGCHGHESKCAAMVGAELLLRSDERGNGWGEGFILRFNNASLKCLSDFIEWTND
jgi:hypothetical protein